jgi:hypothetical protein
MESKETSTLSEERIKQILSVALRSYFGDAPQRLKIYKGGNRLNFCCPYCGDSKDARKKRGNFYLDSFTYKCYNDGCSIFRNLNTFVRDFEIRDMLTTDEISEISEISKSAVSRKKIRNSIDFYFSKNYKEILVPRDILKEKLLLTDVKGTFAEKWLISRNQIPDEKFLWDPRLKNLYILNLSGDETNVIGLQVRNIVKKYGSKYYTYKLSGIYKNLLNVKDSEIIRKAEEIDPVSNVFGFSTVDLDSMITVFEGPFDSFLCPNSVALCSVNNAFPFDVTNKRWLLDSDKAGRNKSMEMLKNGEEVFLWGKFLNENNLPDREKWDLNDVVDYVRDKKIKINRLDNYFSSNILDIIDL